jgi:hypothetical protein
MLQRVPSVVQTAALLGLVIWRFGQPIMERVSPSTATFEKGIMNRGYDLADKLNGGEIQNVEQMDYEEVHLVVGGVLRLFTSKSFNTIDNDPILVAQIKAFDAAYRNRMASAAIGRYRELYYKNHPEDEDEGRLNYLDSMIQKIQECERRGVSSRECVRGFREAIFESGWDIMPESLERYLSDEPLGGSLSGNAVAENVVWDKRRRIVIKREQARRAGQFGRDQESAYRNRMARRLRS